MSDESAPLLLVLPPLERLVVAPNRSARMDEETFVVVEDVAHHHEDEAKHKVLRAPRSRVLRQVHGRSWRANPCRQVEPPGYCLLDSDGTSKLKFAHSVLTSESEIRGMTVSLARIDRGLIQDSLALSPYLSARKM